MSTMTHQIQAEPIPAKAVLITLPRTTGDRSVKWIKWIGAASLSVVVAPGALPWRAHLQNAIPVSRLREKKGASLQQDLNTSRGSRSNRCAPRQPEV